LISITNVLGSTLYRISDEKILLHAGPEKCVLATKSFTAKVAILYLLANQLAGTYEAGASDLQKAIAEVERLLQRKEKIRTIAKHIEKSQHVFILGRGVSYPTALESSLKIKEVSYIHSEGFAAGELKHGVIALVEKGTPVIVYNPSDETYEETLSAAYEVKARGAYVIGISDKHNDVYDEFIEVGSCRDATIIPNVVVAQLLGYYLALEKGYDPDKPRNLAKSVTVK
jgi:glucosamine--fructose-6-phosphate aminotransferase (isomerizing)